LLVFPAVLALLLVLSLAHPPNAVYLCAGAAVGVLLGILGLRLTRFEVTEAGHFYTPNAHLGIALSLLLVGRIAYRFVSMQWAGGAAAGPPPDLVSSPLTLLIFATMAGYYVLYAAGILRWKSASRVAGSVTGTGPALAMAAEPKSTKVDWMAQDADEQQTSEK
jgi:hypothetical protein